MMKFMASSQLVRESDTVLSNQTSFSFSARDTFIL
jgi:hypothetical protein